MRIALLTPLPPEPTGIADYAAELIPALSGRCDLTVYSNAPADLDVPWQPISEYRPQPGVIPLYQIGNSLAHEAIYRIAVREPGIAVLHDTVLHHFVSTITEARGDGIGYLRELAISHGAAGITQARRVLRGDGAALADAFPATGRIVNASYGVIVHSQDAADRLRAVRPAADPIVVPHLIAPPPVIDRAEARDRLGLPAEAFLIGSFGLATPEKQIGLVLKAFETAELGEWHYLIVGEDGGLPPVPAPIADRVTITGRVPWDRFQTYLAAVDVAVALRFPTRGETSGATLRALAAGTPVIASNFGSFRDLPATLVPLEPQAIAAALERFAGDPAARLAEGEAARSWVAATLAPDIVAGLYLDAIQRILDRLP